MGAFFLTDSRYIEAARRAVSGCEVEELTNLSAQLPMLLRANGIKRLMLEAERVTLSQAARYQAMLPDVELDTGDGLDQSIDSLRMVKSARGKRSRSSARSALRSRRLTIFLPSSGRA